VDYGPTKPAFSGYLILFLNALPGIVLHVWSINDSYENFLKICIADNFPEVGINIVLTQREAWVHEGLSVSRSVKTRHQCNGGSLDAH
jgi:hypothetical protein